MKQRVLFKKLLFHALFTKTRAQNGAILNCIVHLLLRLNAHRQGKKKFFSPVMPLSQFAQTLTQPTPSHGLPPY
jgi:hypothetical protein